MLDIYSVIDKKKLIISNRSLISNGTFWSLLIYQQWSARLIDNFYSSVKKYRRKSQTTRKRWEFLLEQGTFPTNIQLYQNYIMQTCQYL